MYSVYIYNRIMQLIYFQTIKIMTNKVSIEVSNDLYQEFLELKETISLMAKDQITDEDLVWFLVQEISASIDMMVKDWNHGHGWHDCCGWEKHWEDHECCGWGHCK